MKRIFALLLRLFPKTYWDEYSDELQAVFDLSLDDAMQAGMLEVARVALRELLSLPKAIILEHLRERRKAHMAKKFGAYFDFTYGSRREFISALYPFILVGFVDPLITVLVISNLLTPRSVLVNGIGIVVVVSRARKPMACPSCTS